MTKDKDFKRIVRDEAEASGRPYSAVRADLRPPTVTASIGDNADSGDSGDDFAARFASIVESVNAGLLGQPEVVRLVSIGLVVGAPMLLTALPGAGRTTLAKGVATAVGANPVFVNGAADFDPESTSTWSGGDLVLVDQFDAMEPTHQAAVMTAARRPALLLAGRSPLAELASNPLGQEAKDRCLFDVEIGYADEETELRVLEGIRSGPTGGGARRAVDVDALLAMRATAAAVDVPEAVKRFAVRVVAATRTDEALLVGGSLLATTSLVQGAAVVAAADGRSSATVDDIRPLLRPALAHRVVFRDGVKPDVDAVVARAVAAV